jgi:putative salt-induced outer membrane protein YdiY
LVGMQMKILESYSQCISSSSERILATTFLPASLIDPVTRGCASIIPGKSILKSTRMNRNRLCLIACALATSISVLHAADNPATPEPPPQWKSTAFLGFTLTRGNSDTVLVTANVKTEKKGKDNEWQFGADGAYGENDSVKNQETLHGFGQYNRLFTERLFGYARVDGLYDAIADVDYRVSLSPGLGYYFIKNKTTSLAGEVGPGYVFEKRGGQEDCYPTVRLAERFEHKFNDKARMWQTLEFLPEATDFGNHVINAEIGVAASLSKSLELSVVLQDTYVSEPAAGRKSNDVKIVSGVTYKF